MVQKSGKLTSWPVDNGKYPIIYRGFKHVRCLFGISELSTVALKGQGCNMHFLNWCIVQQVNKLHVIFPVKGTYDISNMIQLQHILQET